jgi:hypothetical protein
MTAPAQSPAKLAESDVRFLSELTCQLLYPAAATATAALVAQMATTPGVVYLRTTAAHGRCSTQAASGPE